VWNLVLAVWNLSAYHRLALIIPRWCHVVTLQKNPVSDHPDGVRMPHTTPNLVQAENWLCIRNSETDMQDRLVSTYNLSEGLVGLHYPVNWSRALSSRLCISSNFILSTFGHCVWQSTGARSWNSFITISNLCRSNGLTLHHGNLSLTNPYCGNI